ncbi:trigger factor [Inhella inkyongensis]|uniref:Trigger factor n=1 Tax=Inhella inkyongensis TaxID=392593 RepID=A0A840SBK9_9BURK|nr:trigger factor [Inhella inkyongensis]MBB5205851.1 trigger factor [Inhella inkyongensis]
MAVTVETLEKLERRITLTLPAAAVSSEVEQRLKKLSRTVKADGFRPGKVPLSFVAQRYGSSVQYEVVTDQLGQAFAKAASEAQLRVAGMPKLAQKDGAAEGEIAFDATFEVYPEIKMGDLSAVEVERVSSEVTEEAVDRTVEILRKQRRTFAQRAAAEGAMDDDRVTIDFEGKIDGEPFAGGKAEAFQFIIGEGQMLEAFEKAVRGMKSGESKTFPLAFPEDYHGKDVAGKEADFLVTVKKIEQQNLPEVNEAFAKALGIKEGTVEGLRADVRKNLEREVKFRVLAKNKAAAMDALVQVAELDLPKALIEEESQRLAEQFRERLKAQGLKDTDKVPLQSEMFAPQAERRVRLGLVVGELVRTEKLQAQPEQLQAHIEELSQSYEKPADVMRWYLGDRQRMQEVEAVVVENNVTGYVLNKAKVVDKALPFDELMAQAQG